MHTGRACEHQHWRPATPIRNGCEYSFSVLHVFIDTNVYLTFFSFAEDDLEELRKLRVAINNREVKLWTTTQARDELHRNREAKVADSMQALRKAKPGGAIPQMARNLPEFGAFLQARREFDRHLNGLHQELSEQFDAGTLAADRVLHELMEVAETIEVDDQVLDAARRRADIGNPPGKRGSLGDAINWECLLRECRDGKNLYFVTQDSDFISKMDSDRISAFLADEWREAKSSDVLLYKRISSLFRDKFPDIQLASELEKELRIRSLVESPSFDRTHAAIAALSGYTDFSEQQARDLLEGAMRNSQIRWIIHDHDVQSFYRRLLEAHREVFEDDALARFARTVADDDDEDDLEAADDPI